MLFNDEENYLPRVEPVAGYQVIYADPPWFYGQRANTDRFRGGARRHYSVMTDAEILAMPVQSLAADSAVLFLWATWPRLPLALDVIKAWGFRYATCGFDWFKVNPEGGLFFGVGYYTKSNSEPCLLATRGKAIKPATDTISMALEDFDLAYGGAVKDMRREHSRKPDLVRRRIEQLYPHCSKLELFARQATPGWDVYGNEVRSDVSLA